MPRTLQILSAPWLLPITPRGATLLDHAIVVLDGRIADIVPRQVALERYPGVQHEHFPQHVLMPGFVNAHTHAAMNLLRGVGGDRPLMEWLQEHVWPLESRLLSPEFVAASSRIAIAEMLRGGTTCFSDMYLFPETTAEIAAATGIRAVIGLTVIDFPTPWAASSLEYFTKGHALAEAYAGHERIRFALAPHAPYTVGDDSLLEIAQRARTLQIPIHMHVHETAFEVSRAETETGERPLARLRRLGLLDLPFIAVHMTQLNETEHAWLTQHPVSVVHCPESNLKLASGFCPIGRLLADGVNVALGTDGAASNNDLDMLGEMHTAALLAKGVANDATTLPAWQALEIATLGGARALGLEDSIGSLEIGKQADIIAMDVGQLECLPAHDPFSQVVYACTRDAVTDVFVGGRPLMRKRDLLSLDIRELSTLAQHWQGRIQMA
jgi:5-methylthioadenosine/S-adenosylhomocysteine deaminase